MDAAILVHVSGHIHSRAAPVDPRFTSYSICLNSALEATIEL